MEKNKLPSEATTIEHELAKNKAVFTVDCFLHPKDMEVLSDVIFDYVKTKCQKSEDFSKEFNAEIDAVKNTSSNSE